MKKKKKLSSSERVVKATTDYLNRVLVSNLLKELDSIVDNGTNYITVPTPKGWKCKKKNCFTRFKHNHSTYSCLLNDK